MAGDWWARHIGHTIAYAGAAKAGHEGPALKATVGLMRGTLEWGKIVEHRTGKPAVGTIAAFLMAEHIVAAKLIADRGPQSDPRAVQVAIDLVGRNAYDQAKLYGASLDGFPHAEFQKLFSDHGALTAKYMAYLAQNDNPSFMQATQAARDQGELLDEFTDQHFR